MKFARIHRRLHRRRPRGPRRRARSRPDRRSALEGIARQPEVAGKIQTNMLLAAVLVEGVGIIALVICILAIVC